MVYRAIVGFQLAVVGKSLLLLKVDMIAGKRDKHADKVPETYVCPAGEGRSG
jgi:hypothetical protein